MIDRTYYCEGPNSDRPEGLCMASAGTASDPPYLPLGVIETRNRLDSGDEIHHFCSWDCAMKYAAQQPIAEVIEVGDA